VRREVACSCGPDKAGRALSS